MNNQPRTLERKRDFRRFNINTDCMVSDIYEKYDTPNGAVVYGLELNDHELENKTFDSRYGFVILLENNHFLFRDIIDVTPTNIILKNRKDIQQEVLHRNEVKSYFKIETREYF